MRIGIGVLLLAALVAAFSLRGLPTPLEADLPAEAFDGAAATTMARAIARDFPERTAGSPGDASAAVAVAAELRRALPTAAVTTDEFESDTPDGRRTLRNVTAVLPGQPGPELLVIAHRDAIGRGSAAEASATAGLIGLARAAGQSRFRHTVRFVSTDGASGGGLSGATRLARTLRAPVAAAIVLGDLSGGPDRQPMVVPWSNATRAAPLRLTRTVEEALRTEGLRPRDSEGVWMQLVRRGLPASVGEQAELNQGGIPAVLLGAGGATPPAADAAVDPGRLRAFGRSALRSLLAVDEVGQSVGPQQTGLVIAGQEVPSWALRVLLLTLLVPLAVGALVLGIAVHREGAHLLAGATWAVGCAAGPLIAGLIAVGAGRVGLAWPALPAPFAGEAVRTGFGAAVLVVVLLAILAGTTAAARPYLTREATGHHRPTRPAVAFGVFLIVLVPVLVLVVVNPLAAVLLLPALVAWPASVAPLPGVQPLHRLGLGLLGAALPFAALVTLASTLDVRLVQVPWWLVLLVAGGHIAPLNLLLTSLVAGAAIATALALVPPLPNPFAGRRPRPRWRGAADGTTPPDDAPEGRPAAPDDDGHDQPDADDDWGDGAGDRDDLLRDLPEPAPPLRERRRRERTAPPRPRRGPDGARPRPATDRTR
jgi:hypothetical protein